jgi:hypothetical protein
VAIFIVLVVVLIAGQTWRDWRDTRSTAATPPWARGVALGGMLALGLTAATALASTTYQAALGGWSAQLTSSSFLPEAVFVILAMGVIVLALKKKSMRLLFALAGLLAAAIALTVVLLT